ncbi:hypothetical protein PACTADRAFT_59367 [Pachysolen tannophilus NRRL Y-2460]|uniref:Ketoreductase domain-containing protein n=1 Tax=Pachysolen tannophilus NRRL Y-2460 TaxID=669874 RepID=A0A1E4TSW2_PACTA|nr:hypothetical protein PACTADRAFT_59367 [Pachysolen tannophilus NRRL Y-2460]
MPVIILTGASKGIGASVAKILLSSHQDTKLIAISRSEEPLKQLVLKYGEDRIGYVAGDVSDEKTSSSAVKLAISKFGGIDSIIINAGILEPVESIANVNINEWKKLFDINFFAAISLVSEALPELRNSKGNVVFVSSGASTKSTYGWAPYGSSKAALNHLCLSLASEEPEISTISVAPGVVDTAMQDDIRLKFGKSMKPEELKRFTDLKQNSELLDPIVPATIYANLSLRGFSKELNGQYMRYNDQRLTSYNN